MLSKYAGHQVIRYLHVTLQYVLFLRYESWCYEQVEKAHFQMPSRVARFILTQQTQMAKICQTIKKYQNGHDIHQYFPSQDLPKYTNIGTLGMKIYVRSGNPDAIFIACRVQNPRSNETDRNYLTT
jgi:hypothetical protein